MQRPTWNGKFTNPNQQIDLILPLGQTVSHCAIKGSLTSTAPLFEHASVCEGLIGILLLGGSPKTQLVYFWIPSFDRDGTHHCWGHLSSEPTPRWNTIRICYMAITFLTLRHLRHRININNGALIMMRIPLYIFLYPRERLCSLWGNPASCLKCLGTSVVWWSLLPAFTVPVS